MTIGKIEYYFWAIYRRKILDKLLEKNIRYIQGVVLDIGGRDRGRFAKPKDSVKQWIFADIDEKHHPDIVLDVTDMAAIENESIDTICANELFEHVNYPEKGIAECHRTLKKGGAFLISTPFLFGIHADPCDYQRWTEEKWKLVLGDAGFQIQKIITMGYFFSAFCDILKTAIKQTGKLKYLFYPLYPIFDLLTILDKTSLVKRSGLAKSVGGYFIIAKK